MNAPHSAGGRREGWGAVETRDDLLFSPLILIPNEVTEDLNALYNNCPHITTPTRPQHTELKTFINVPNTKEEKQVNLQVNMHFPAAAGGGLWPIEGGLSCGFLLGKVGW